jgi:pimeloyl-ACP methyl ester carboxylesterase
VLVGAEDQLCPPARHREIKALLPNAVFAEIAGAGHISTLEQPETVTKALRSWLQRPV